jgi:hypothetical protein
MAMSPVGTKQTIEDVRSLVRYQAISGQQMLRSSISAFDPNQTSVTLAIIILLD